MPTDQLGADGDRFHVLVDTIVDYAIFLLDDGGRVVSWGAGAERLEGYTTGEIIGEHVSRFYLPEDVERGRPQRELDEAAARGRFEAHGWRVRKDGARFRASVVIRPLHSPNGELRGFAHIARGMSSDPAPGSPDLLAERERIAGELQARAVRLLFGIGLELQGVAALANDPTVARRLERCIDRLDESIRELRRIALDG
jgi:PAS domain S-box-containing protein